MDKPQEGLYLVEVFKGKQEAAYFDGLEYTCEHGPISRLVRRLEYEDVNRLLAQRNQLREALEELDTALRKAWSEGRLPHDVVCPYLAQKTSAALKATEEG